MQAIMFLVIAFIGGYIGYKTTIYLELPFMIMSSVVVVKQIRDGGGLESIPFVIIAYVMTVLSVGMIFGDIYHYANFDTEAFRFLDIFLDKPVVDKATLIKE